MRVLAIDASFGRIGLVGDETGTDLAFVREFEINAPLAQPITIRAGGSINDDPTRFSIPFVVGGAPGAIEGRISEADVVDVEVKMQPGK